MYSVKIGLSELKQESLEETKALMTVKYFYVFKVRISCL